MSNRNEHPENVDINAIPIKWGIITTLVSVILFTLVYMFMIDNLIMFGITSIAIMAVPIVFFGIAAAQQRKAFGGFIELKDAFRAIFIVIVISSVVYNLYTIAYTEFIDPQYMDKIKNSMLTFADKTNMEQSQLDKMLSDFDSKTEQQGAMGARFLGILIQIIVYSIFGFIIAAIVKKKRPELGQ